MRVGTLLAAFGWSLLAVSGVAAAQAGPQTLVDLIRDGNREAVLAAITSPAVDVNAAAPDGSTPLMWATYKVDHEMVRALLKARRESQRRPTALVPPPWREAVKLGDVDLVRMLLDAHADANSPNEDGETALMVASSIGSLPIAQLLISHGATANAVENFRGQTALMWAAAQDHPDIVDLLLAHGADVKRRAKYDDWPRQMTSEPRAQFRQTGGPHGAAVCDPFGVLPLRGGDREGARGRESAQSGRHHSADQCDRQPQLRHCDVPAGQGREPGHLGHERPHAAVRRGGHELLQGAGTFLRCRDRVRGLPTRLRRTRRARRRDGRRQPTAGHGRGSESPAHAHAAQRQRPGPLRGVHDARRHRPADGGGDAATTKWRSRRCWRTAPRWICRMCSGSRR